MVCIAYHKFSQKIADSLVVVHFEPVVSHTVPIVGLYFSIIIIMFQRNRKMEIVEKHTHIGLIV
jgi:hypothetical protein